MPMVLDVYHYSPLKHLQDIGRVAPKHEVHPPPVVASPLEDHPLEP
jgi:hypothetical protein